MKQFLKSLPFALATAAVTLAAHAHAQTVQIKGIGSSALFLESGLAAQASTANHGLGASCLWTSNSSATSSPSNIVRATDVQLGAPGVQDSGSAWVAWTPDSTGSCTNITAATTIYSYLQTDSVVGDRCLFDAHFVDSSNVAHENCTIAYPSNASGIATSNLILASGEVSLPMAVSTALNGATAHVNAAGTDIRPEDAAFASARGVAPCGVAIAGSQYKSLGYGDGGNISSFYGGSDFHVINFKLPSTFNVTPVGATPILVVINGDSTGFGSTTITNIDSQHLADFLDGDHSYTSQVASTATTGERVTVLVREPLSGTYNTMEYNVPNTTAIQTSQDVGINQLTPNCSGNVPLSNPMNITTASGGHRRRAIGTGQELSEVLDLTNNDPNTLGYGFWSVANYKGFTSTAAPNARYLKVDNVDPLIDETLNTHTGVLPLAGSADLANVNLNRVKDGTYPIWSLLRFVTVDSTALTQAQALATATQGFVSFGTASSRPDFITVANLTKVRSHFIPPAGINEPTTAFNGHVGRPLSSCSATEAGGDVGGVVIDLATDSTTCAGQPAGSKTGTTGLRR